MGWFLTAVLLIAAWIYISYNKLRRLAESVKGAQANVAAVVKKRQDVAQRLADIAMGYGDHEKLTHFSVVGADAGVAQAAAATADATRMIGNMQMLAARFPELKANETYQQLMVQLDGIESDVLARREGYNRAAESYNGMRGSLPHLFYAQKMGFNEAPYFAMDDSGDAHLATFRTDDGTVLRESMGRMASIASSQAQGAAERLKAVGVRVGQETAKLQDRVKAAADQAEKDAEKKRDE